MRNESDEPGTSRLSAARDAPDAPDVPALRRTHDVLECLAAAQAPVKPAALLAATGLSRSTLYLLLDALERRHWIEKRQGGYLIGLKLFELGSGYARHDGLQALFREEAINFVAEHNEVVQLAVLDAAEVVYIAREDARRPVRLVSDLGSRLPAHCCALGKALLAGLPEAAVRALLPETLEPLTPKTVTRRDVLLQELAEVRANGLAQEREEVSAGLACFAAYVGETASGKRVAVSTSIPLGRLDPQRERQIAVGIAGMASQMRKAL